MVAHDNDSGGGDYQVTFCKLQGMKLTWYMQSFENSCRVYQNAINVLV